MKRNTLFKTALALCAGAFVLAASTSEAAIIPLTPTGGSQGDDIAKNGTGIAGGNSNNTENNYYRLITYFNVDDYCEPTDVDSWKPTNQTNVWASGLKDYDYAVVHYGAGRGGVRGAGGGVAAYYLNGEDSATFPANGLGPNAFGGFSSVDFFKCKDDDHNVPEGGASVALLGLTLAGLGVARRVTKKA